MPREITHWLIAADVATGLGETDLGGSARARPELCALGAVFHDALFYAPAAASGFAHVADALHGEDGGDTFVVVRGLAGAARELRAAGSPLAGAVEAFLVGVVAHLHADATFHPLVYYHSGLPRPDGRLPTRAAQAHRRLETVIDVFLLGALARVADHSLAAHLAAAGGTLRDLCQVAAASLVAPPSRSALVDAFLRAFARFARAQGLFRRPAPSAAAHAVRGLLPDGLREIEALGYPPALAGLARRLAGPLDYRHPATGVAARTTLTALRERAAAAAVATCRRLAATPAAATPLAGELGPSLVAGLPGVGAAGMFHVAAAPLLPD